MHALYLTSVVIHVLAAAVWVGGQAAFALIIVPIVRRRVDATTATSIFRDAGARLAVIGGICLGLLLVTGLTNLAFRGVLPLLGSGAFWRTPFGTTLAAKLVVVGLILAVSTVHVRSALRAAIPQTEALESIRARQRERMQGRATLTLSVMAVVLAVFLVRGMP